MRRFVFLLLSLAAAAPLFAQAGDDVLSNLEWDVYVREFNDEVQQRQQRLEERGYTPSRPEGAGPEAVTWLVVPSMGFQWHREGGGGEFENGKEGKLSVGDMLNHSYGVMLGGVKTYGGYVRYRYSKTDDPWIDMKSHQIRAGALYRSDEYVYLYGGVGVELYKSVNSYSKQKLQPGQPWQPVTEKDNWFAVEAGIMARWKFLILSGGMSYSFSKGTFDGADSGADIGFDLGIGIAIGR